MKKLKKILGKTAKKKFVALLTTAFFLCSQTGFAQVVTNITTDGRTNTNVTTSGATRTVETTTVHGKTGFNSFSRFDLASGDTANLNVPTGADNLVNIVSGSKSFIDGTLNAFRNGKIGGNIFFLNSNGIAIGATGVVNVGALTLAAPSADFIANIFTNGLANFNAGSFSQALAAGDVPLNPSGTISVKGKVNAYYGAAIHANNIEISGAGSQINTLKADIVNMGDIDTDVSIYNEGGRILLKGKKIDVTDGASLKSIAENASSKAGDITLNAYAEGSGSLFGESVASIKIDNAELTGENVNITAETKNVYDGKNSNMNFNLETGTIPSGDSFLDIAGAAATELMSKIKEYTDGNVDAAFGMSSVKSVIEIGDGAKIKAQNDLEIKTAADSKITVTTESEGILALSVGVNLVDSTINIGAASLEAGNDITIEAKSKITSEVEAKVTSDDQFKAAVAVSAAISDTSVKLDGTVIDAGNNAAISTAVEESIKTKAVSEKKESEGSEGEGKKISIGIPINYTNVKNNNEIKNADIKADKNIDIAGKNIKIEDSKIKSVNAAEKGNITIKSEDKGSEIISTRKASIDISNTEIEGKDITIEATAENKYKYEDLESAIEIGSLEDTLLGVANEVLEIIGDLTDDAIKGKIAKSDVSANINISGNTKINADNDINIKTSVESQTTVKTDAKGLGVSVAVNLSESKIDIGKASLTAGNNINLNAENKITSEVEAKSSSHAFGDVVELGGAVGVAYIKGETSINLSKDSDINAGKDVTIDAKTEKDTSITVETKAGEKANAGLAVGVNLADVENTVLVKGKIKADNDVNINSKIDSKNTKQNISASTGNKKEEDKDKDKDKEEGQKSNLNTKDSNLQKKTDEKETNKNSGIEKDDNGNTITLAGAVLYTDIKNTAKAEISGPDAEVEALNNINMKAEVINANIKQFVDAAISGDQDSQIKGTGAVVIGNYTDNVTAVVKDRASIDAGKKIDISSNHEMPFDSTWIDLFEKFVDNPGLDTGKDIFEKISETKKEGEGTTEEKIVTSLKDDLVNTWVRSSAPEGEGEDNKKKEDGGKSNENDKKEGGSSFNVSVSGAVNITSYDFSSEAYIQDAKVNQKSAAELRTGEQSVNVEAKSKTTSVTVGGIFGDSYKSPLGQGGADVGVGGTYNQEWYKTKTNAYIERSLVYANDLNVKANYDQLDVTIGIAGGESKTFGLQGVFNWLKSESNVNALIKDSTINVETSAELPSGGLNIEAKYTPLLVNIAGSLSMAETAAVGASVALNDIQKATNAKITGSVINNSQNAKLFALSDGLIHSYAIAAAYAGKNNTKDKNNQTDKPDKDNMANKNSGTSEGSGDSGSFGIAISGSAGVSDIRGEGTNASIEDTTYTGTKTLEIIAKEDSDIVNATGGVSITSPDADTGVAIAGAGSISWIENNAKAYIKNSTVKNDGDITLDAKTEAGIVSVAVGLSGSFSSDGVAVAGSGSVNLTNNSTLAYIENSKIISGGNLNINSSDDSDIFALAGAVAVAAGAAGIGAAIGVNILNNDTSSYIKNSDILLTGNTSKNNISLNSQNSSDIISIAGAVGVGLGQVGVAVTVNVNVLNNKTQSYIIGSGLEAIKAENIFLSAKDNSDILAIAGAAGVGNNVGIGIGVGFNYIGNSASSYIEDAEIENKGNIEVKALSESEVQLIVAALGGAGTVGVAGAVGAAYVHKEAEAFIKNSIIVSEGSIGLLADNKNDIQLYSGSLAIGGTVGVGANVGLHFLGSKSNAYIDNSNITAKGSKALSAAFGNSLLGLTVKSNIYDKIFTVSAALAGSGTVSVSGGITGAIIRGESTAKIKNSRINELNNGYANSGVSVVAENETDVAVIAGAVAGSGTVGVSVAADFETMENKVEAGIENCSVVNARGDVEVKTGNTEKYAAALISGAVSGGVSVAGNVVVGVNTSENRAYIEKSNITARNVSVLAKDAVIIGEVNPSDGKIGIAMGTLAGGAYAGVAGTVFTSVISNSTIAEIVSSNITASGNIKLDAEGYQKTFANLATFGGAIAGIAVTAGVSVNNTDTFARIRRADGDTNTYTLRASDILVTSKNTLEVDKIFFGGSGGVVGVTAGVSVGVYNNNVTAGIGSGFNLAAGRNVEVSAQNDRNINDIVVSVAGGGVAVTATVDVIVVGGNVNGDKIDESDTSTDSYLEGSKDDVSDNMKMSNRIKEDQVGGGGLIDTNDIKKFDYDDSAVYGTVRENGTIAYIDANVTAVGNVGVAAIDNIEINANIGAASVGGVSVGASVAVQDLTTRTEARIGAGSIISANDISIIANANTANTTGIYMGGAGAVAVNAGVSVINSKNYTYASIGNGAQINRARDINVLANATSNITSNFINVGIGAFAAVGAVVGVINKGGNTDAWIGNNVNIGNQSALIPTVNSLTVKAQTNNNIDADMIAAAGGIGLSAVVNVFSLNINDNLKAYTGTGSKLNLYNLSVLTDGNTAVNALFAGGAIGAVSIAASLAFSRINLQNEAYIGSNNTVKADNVLVKAYHNVISDAKAIGASGGALVGANGVVIDNLVKGNVIASLVGGNSIFQVSKKLSVLSDSNISQTAQALTITLGGLIALGLVILDNESRVNTKSQLGGGLSIFAAEDENGNKTGTGEVEVKAGSIVNLLSQSQSGTGSIYGAIGGTSNRTSNNSSTDVTIGGVGDSSIYAKNLDIMAKAVSRQNAFVDAASAGLVSVGVVDINNKSNSNVTVNITGITDIIANNIYINASNIFSKIGSGANLDAISLGLASGFFAKSITDINNNTKVNLGAQTNLMTIKDENKESSFIVDLYNNSTAVDLAKLVTVAGGAVSVIESTVNNNSNAEAIFAGKIYAGKDFTVNSKADQNLDTQTYIDAVAFISGVQGNTNSIANIKNTITFESGADIYAAGNLNLNLSKSDTGGSGIAEISGWSFYGSKSITEIYNMAAIAIDGRSKANSIINVDDFVNVKSGASLKSSKNVNIASTEGRSYETGVLHVYTPLGEVATKESDRKVERNVNSLLTVNGSILAGANNNIEIEILQDGSVVFKNPEIFVNYKTGTMNLINNIIKQKEALVKLRGEYGASADIAGAIDAEIARLNAQLEALGFRVNQDGIMIDVTFADVPYIEFGDMAAGRGDIQIEMNNVNGGGSLKANAMAEVKISNYSDKFLRINDILISDDAQGDIFVNRERVFNSADVTDKTKDKMSNSLTINSNNGDPNIQPKITIINDGNPGGNIPNLELLGDILNPLGTVTITSEGSIESRGSILARTINISAAKDFVQTAIKNEYIFHVGGDPKQVWNGVANTNETNKSNTFTNTPANESNYYGRSSIIANNVYISGTYLDINGLIQAGIENWNLNIGDTIYLNFGDGTIAAAVRDYMSKNSATANPLYKLNTSYHGNLTAYYNVLTGNIEVASVNIEGGKLYLYGSIMNTSAQGYGKLVALDGYARVSITNTSESDIILHNINTDKKINGEIKITDLARDKVFVNGKWVPLETTYTFEDGQIKMTTNSGSVSYGNNDGSVKYNPRSDIRYTWTTGTQDVTRETYYHEQGSFWGMSFLVPDVHEMTLEGRWTVTDPLMRGEYVTYGSGDLYTYNYQWRGYESEIVNYQQGSFSKGWWIFSTQHYWRRITWQFGSNNFNTHSISAANPISIGFVGYANPQNININSNTTVGLRGNINSGTRADVIINSGGAIEGLSAGAQVNGRNITLNAVNGIGTTVTGTGAITVGLKGGVFNAVNSGIGNIDLIAKTNDNNFKVFKIGNITTQEGDVKLISDEEIAMNTATGKIKGENIEIESKNGAITGFNGADLEIEADTIKAKAYGDIKLIKKSAGDLGVTKIYSTAGDVRLTVSKGSAYNINEYLAVDERKKSELLSLWDDMLGLFDAGRVVTYEDGSTETLAWTKDQLLYAMNGARAGGGFDYYEKEDNIRGKNVVINVAGSVGLNEQSIYIDMENFSFADLDENQKLLLAGANYHNTFWHRVDDEDPTSKLIGITILNQKDMIINASGSLSVDSKEYAYISSENDINIDQVKSDGTVTIKSKGGIYSISSGDRPNIVGSNIMLDAENGSIGALGKKITIDTAGVLTANASDGSIYLSAENNLSLNYVFADYDVFIDAKGNISSDGYDSSDYENINARCITLNEANVGTAVRSLNIALSGGPDSMLNVSASGNIYVDNVGTFGGLFGSDLCYGNISAGEYVSLKSNGSIFAFDENALITAKNLFLDAYASNGSIGAEDNKVKADVKEVISAVAEGDIYIEAQNKGNFEEIKSYQGIVDLSSLGNLYADKIRAEKDINIVSAGFIETGTQYIDSIDGKITIAGKGEVNINAAVSSKEDIEIQSEENALNVSGNIVSSEGNISLSSEGKTEITGTITADKNITAGSQKELIMTGGLTAINGDVSLSSEGKTEITGTITADKNITADSQKELIMTGGLTSVTGNVALSSKHKTEITGTVIADKNITADSQGELIVAGGLTSANGSVALSSKDKTEIAGTITADEDITADSQGEIKIAGGLTSVTGNVVLSSKGKTEITGTITADKDINTDSKKELIIKGDLTADGSVSLKSGEKTDIDGAIIARDEILSLVEKGGLTINGAIRTLEGPINFNVLNGAMIIGNKVVSERGSIVANVFGDITGNKTNTPNAGFYAGYINLASQNGDIGKSNNLLFVDNENPDFVKASFTALNGGIYVEGFTNGLNIERFACGQDLAIISNGDIIATDLGNKLPNVIAKNITLHSLTGSVGKEDSRIIVEPIKEKGKVNLSAVTGIYVDQYAHNTFFSDYVRNSGKGNVSLLIPNNNAFIVDFSVLPGTNVNIAFIENKHVKNVGLRYNDIKKIMVNPTAVLMPIFKTASETQYEILSDENIENYMKKMQNGDLTISSNLMQ
ncbi:MAG: leukotoxin LktA family filamentous adhesin [Endomicrobia bacterium]|nr:leukotoxin LktA family filamentous adhesin [Endomicrobiia bacterium]